MIKSLLLVILPFLSAENWKEVKQQSETQVVGILFVTDGCIPCEAVKPAVPNDTYIVNYSTREGRALFRLMTKQRIRHFPTYGVWYQGKFLMYETKPRILEFLQYRNRYNPSPEVIYAQ